MNQKTFSLVAGIIFLAIAVLHLTRILMGWEAIIAGWQVPVWVSWVGVVVAGYLGYKGVRRK
ncbi:MAG: hypothetical protein HY458_00600 [Parcubacteria group bacterium]|nr:hypothetical protein [Parcubacteria group bacterium]